MSTASPSVSRSSGGRGASLAHAETRPRTMVGLHRADVQLQHELDRIDRQAFTAVSNIANHQQAMKMSWRRLEAQRNSPKMSQRPRSRSCSDHQLNEPRRSLLSSNKTRLYVSATPQVYFGGGSSLPRDQSHPAGEEGKTRGMSPTPFSLQLNSPPSVFIKMTLMSVAVAATAASSLPQLCQPLPSSPVPTCTGGCQGRSVAPPPHFPCPQT